jgi:transposase
MTVTHLGIDLSKLAFHVVGEDELGHVQVKRKFTKVQLLRFTANLPPCGIGMEACCGAHYLGRRLVAQGHDVRLIPAQYVRPFVKSHKNDYLDAEAIVEAVRRPTMRFVPLKGEQQLDLQALHRVRDRLVGRRTAVINQIRAFLLERGITVRQGSHALEITIPRILADPEIRLSSRMVLLISELVDEWRGLGKRIDCLTNELETLAKIDPAAGRIGEIPGVGPIIATATVAAIANGAAFKRGRDFAAWLGLVPYQHSTGGKTKLLGISKRGNGYLRRLFVHGARSALRSLVGKTTGLGRWITALIARVHINVAVVALANKIARIVWAVLAGGVRFDVHRSTHSTASAM